VCRATVRYAGEGYLAHMGWVQLIGPPAGPTGAQFLRSVFDDPLQAGESLVPSLRDLVERAARFVEPLRLQLLDTLLPATNVADETGAGEDIQVLGDSLTRDGGTRSR